MTGRRFRGAAAVAGAARFAVATASQPIYTTPGRSAMKYAYRISVLIVALFAMLVVIAIAFLGLAIMGLAPMGLAPMGLAIMGLAIWALVPGDRSARIYSVMVIFPLVLFGWVTLLSLRTILPLPEEMSADSERTLIVILSWLIAVALAVLGWVVALRTVLAGRPKTPLLYITAALVSLGVSTALIFVLPRTLFRDSAFYASLMIVMIPSIFSMLVTALIGTTRYPYRDILVGMLVLCVLVTIGGWVRFSMIDDNSDMFTGDARHAALGALSEARSCEKLLDVTNYRVVKDDHGRFCVLGYSWWGFPSNESSCGPYRQGNECDLER